MGKRPFVAIFVPASAALFAIALFSLRWRVTGDAPIMLYMAYLVDHLHAVPYRDFFDMNLPGSYWLYVLLGRVSGYGDVGLRAADLAYLGALSWMTWACMRRIGWQSAWSSVVLFGLVYLDGGPLLSLQREYLLLAPISGAVLLSLSDRGDARARGLGVGLLFGLAATIKLQSALVGLPVLVVFQGIVDRQLAGGRLSASQWLGKTVLPSALGFSLPPLVMLGYLWHAGALSDFLDMARNYWPLYAHLTNEGETIRGSARAIYLVREYLLFGGNLAWLVPSVLGVFVALYHSDLDEPRRRQVGLLVALAIAYSVYPLFSGQFFGYHWLPFEYFLVLTSSLCFVRPAAVSRIGRALPPLALAFACLLVLRPPEEIRLQVRELPTRPPKSGRVDEIASFLRGHLAPGDQVQPLDWTGGAVHAMLIARAEIATPFVYDFYFYHHVSNPFIQKLRGRFMAAMTAAPPRFVIQIETRKPWPSGEDTTREFPELQQLLDSHYSVASRGDGYTIYERTAHAS